MARLEQTVRIFLEAYDVQVWVDLIGLDLENKAQWGTYYYDYGHHGEPGHISKNLRIHSSSRHITGYKADEFAAMSYCWVSCNLWPWSSRHEYQDYCHHDEPGHI